MKIPSAVPESTPGLTLTPSAASASVVHQLHELWVDGLVGLLQHFDQLSGLFEIPRSEEGICSALVGATSCSANPMHIILRAVWIVIVDDKLDIFHIFGVGDESLNR